MNKPGRNTRPVPSVGDEGRELFTSERQKGLEKGERLLMYGDFLLRTDRVVCIMFFVVFIVRENPQRFVILPIQYHSIWRKYKQQVARYVFQVYTRNEILSGQSERLA